MLSAAAKKNRDESNGALVLSLFVDDSWGMSRVQAIEGKGGGVIIRFWYRVALIQCRKKAIQ